MPVWRDPKKGSISSGGDLFHCSKSIGTQALTRLPNILRQTEELPIENVIEYYNDLKNIASIKSFVEDLIKNNLEGNNKVTLNQQVTTSILGIATVHVFHQQHQFLPILLSQCETQKQKIIAIAASVSLKKTQRFIGECHSSKWEDETKVAKIEELQQLMRNDAKMVADFLPNFVCLQMFVCVLFFGFFGIFCLFFLFLFFSFLFFFCYIASSNGIISISRISCCQNFWRN